MLRVWGADAGRGHADAHMQQLPCSEVADHQKMASKKPALGGSLMTGRHKDICGLRIHCGVEVTEWSTNKQHTLSVLSKGREIVKDGVSPDSCTADLLAFLQR